MRYFAYGSNMDGRQTAETCPACQPVGHGKLEGFRLEFNVYSDRWEGGAANLEPDAEAHVWGVVWDISEEDLAALDTYIGHPTYYRQEQVVVDVGGDRMECLTYRVAHQQGYVRPTDSYLNRLRQAIRENGLPPEALDMLDAAARPPRPHIST
jgi:gamma-glutamylcyclotransferase (GGCT)/AIG2-like uncharacterized protein YtfP